MAETIPQELSTTGTFEWRPHVAPAAWLALAALALYLAPIIQFRPLNNAPEARIAVVARQMLASGDYVVPSLGAKTRLIKPPLPYWETAAAAKLIGGGEAQAQRALTRAVELPSALCAALSVFLVVLYGSTVFGRTAGLMAGMILGTAALVAAYAELGYCDITLMFLCAGLLCSTAWILSAPRPGIVTALFFGVFLGLGVLAKWFVPLMVLAGPGLCEVIWRKGLKKRQVLMFLLGCGVATLVVAPWVALVAMRVSGGLSQIITGIVDCSGAVGHMHKDAWIFYFYKLAGGLLPWTVLLLVAWALLPVVNKVTDNQQPTTDNRPAAPEHERGGQPRNGQFRFFTLAAVCGFFVFYISPKQQGYYLLPLFPPIALASGYLLSLFKLPGGKAEKYLAYSQLAVGLLGGVALAAFPLWRPASWDAVGDDNAALRAFLAGIGWGISIPVGALFAGLFALIARHCFRANVLKAVVAMALLGCAGLVVWGMFWRDKAEAFGLYAEGERLKDELRHFDQDTRVYVLGDAEPLFVYYLERPVLSPGSLGDEPEEPAGAAAPRRVMVGMCNTARRLGLDKYVDLPPDRVTFLAELPLEADRLNELKMSLRRRPDSTDNSDD